jgi:hypothetical protein
MRAIKFLFVILALLFASGTAQAQKEFHKIRDSLKPFEQ